MIRCYYNERIWHWFVGYDTLVGNSARRHGINTLLFYGHATIVNSCYGWRRREGVTPESDIIRRRVMMIRMTAPVVTLQQAMEREARGLIAGQQSRRVNNGWTRPRYCYYEADTLRQRYRRMSYGANTLVITASLRHGNTNTSYARIGVTVTSLHSAIGFIMRRHHTVVYTLHDKAITHYAYHC